MRLLSGQTSIVWVLLSLFFAGHILKHLLIIMHKDPPAEMANFKITTVLKLCITSLGSPQAV